MKKILILGGSSDIGLRLLKNLTNEKKFEIHIHYNRKFPRKDIPKGAKLIKKDLSRINNKNFNKIFDKDYDIIVNLVGYVSNQGFSNFNIKEAQKTILVNSLVPFMIIRGSLKNMIKNNFGRIINTSSIGVKFGGGINTFSYSLSKHLNNLFLQK